MTCTVRVNLFRNPIYKQTCFWLTSLYQCGFWIVCGPFKIRSFTFVPCSCLLYVLILFQKYDRLCFAGHSWSSPVQCWVQVRARVRWTKKGMVCTLYLLARILRPSNTYTTQKKTHCPPCRRLGNNQSFRSLALVVSRWLWPGNRTFLEVAAWWLPGG